MRSTFSIADLVLLGIALTGCQFGGGTAGSGGHAEPSAAGSPDASAAAGSGNSDTGCVADKDWHVDVDDLAQQLQERLEAGGMTIQSVDGHGSQLIRFNSTGNMASSTDLTFVVKIELKDTTMTETQHQVGPASAEWAWLGDSNVVTLTEWVENIKATNKITIGGSTSSADLPLNFAGMQGAQMTLECDGDSLTTSSADSPFVKHWTAAS